MSPKNLIKKIYYRALHTLPYSDLGDKIFSLGQFVRVFRRLPRKTQLFNDYIYRTKNSTDGHNPLRAYVTDKALVKNYVRAKLCDDLNVPTIATLLSFDEVCGFAFPDRCCIKPTHLSGAVILRTKGEPIDYNIINNWFRTNYYHIGREKNYRYLTPKVIVEELIFDKTDNEDYKFFCYGGKVRFVQIDLDRFKNHKRLYFDRDWTKQDFSIMKPMAQRVVDKPTNFNAMLEVADALSSDFEFIRIDLYSDGTQIKVGEITNWPENGCGYFIPTEGELKASQLLFSDL